MDKEEKELTFAERLKKEANGVVTLSPEFIKREQEWRMGVF